MVTGGDSNTRGSEFKTQGQIVDGLFSHEFVVLKSQKVSKKEAGLAH